LLIGLLLTGVASSAEEAFPNKQAYTTIVRDPRIPGICGGHHARRFTFAHRPHSSAMMISTLYIIAFIAGFMCSLPLKNTRVGTYNSQNRLRQCECTPHFDKQRLPVRDRPRASRLNATMLPSKGDGGSKKSWSEQSVVNYETSKNLMMGLLAGVFRDDVALKVLRRHMLHCRTWDSAFAKITRFFFPDSDNPLDEMERDYCAAILPFVDQDTAMNGVTVEDVVRVLARMRQPFRASVKAKEDKMKFIEHVCLAFAFRSDDTYDKVLTERMCNAVQSAAKYPIRSKRLRKIPSIVRDDSGPEVTEDFPDDDSFDP
jgi:hypothetical protein